MQIRFGFFICSAALSPAGLVGCGGKEIGEPVSKVSDLVALCSGRHSTAAAAPYAGASPHPILVIRPRDAIQDMLENPRLAGFGRPGIRRTRQPSNWWRTLRVMEGARTRAADAIIAPGSQRH